MSNLTGCVKFQRFIWGHTSTSWNKMSEMVKNKSLTWGETHTHTHCAFSHTNTTFTLTLWLHSYLQHIFKDVITLTHTFKHTIHFIFSLSGTWPPLKYFCELNSAAFRRFVVIPRGSRHYCTEPTFLLRLQVSFRINSEISNRSDS